MNKKIIFGAGKYGHYALNEIGKQNVSWIVDNDKEKIGSSIEGITVISPHKLQSMQDIRDYEIIVAVRNSDTVVSQLNHMGIENITIFCQDPYVYYPTSQLVLNPYQDNGGYVKLSDEAIALKIDEIDEALAKYKDIASEDFPLFDHIEIETVNRCNGGCSFCPVSTKNDTREFKKMSWELFQKIIGELEAIQYKGKIALFSNNEPLLDERIIDFHKYAREHLSNARFHLFTNGTLLKLSKFIDLVQYLDELIIDNYNQNLELIPNCREIVAYCEKHEELRKKVTVVLRKIDEVLTTRGGDAPNARSISYPNAKCVLPFRQIIIRPDGKVSLCCNDPLGRNTLADISKETLLCAWHNARFQMVRKCLLESGREQWNHCKHCDFFSLG